MVGLLELLQVPVVRGAGLQRRALVGRVARVPPAAHARLAAERPFAAVTSGNTDSQIFNGVYLDLMMI